MPRRTENSKPSKTSTMVDALQRIRQRLWKHRRLAAMLFVTATAVSFLGVYWWGSAFASHLIGRKITALTGVACTATLTKITAHSAELLLNFPDQQFQAGPVLLDWKIESLWRRAGLVHAVHRAESASAKSFQLGPHAIQATMGVRSGTADSILAVVEADWLQVGETRLAGPRMDLQLDREKSSIVLAMLVSKNQAATVTYSGTPLQPDSKLRGEGPLQVVFPAGKITSHWKWVLDLDSNQISSHFSNGVFKSRSDLVEFSGSLDWKPPAWGLHLETQIPGDTSKSALWNPLRLVLDSEGPYPKLQGRGKILDMVGGELLPFEFVADAGERIARASVDKQWDLGQSLDLSLISGALDFLKFNAGSLSMKGGVTLSGDRPLAASLNLQLKDAAGTVAEMPITGLNTAIQAPRLFPLSVKPFQIRLASAGNKSPLEEVQLEVSMSKKSLAVVPNTARWAGGLVSALPFEVPLKNLRISTLITVDALDLNSLLVGAGVHHIAAKGKVTGKIPLIYEKDYLTVQGATLTSENGWLRYSDSGVQISGNIDTMEKFQQLVSQGQQALVMKALDNFEYKRLHAKIDRTRSAGLGAKLQIAGKNPNLARGQPFEFNISVAGQVEQLMKRSFFLMSEE